MSPGTRGIDAGQKLAGYFRLPSIQHCLMIDPGKRLLIHHRRGTGDIIETRISSEGWIALTPPGFSVAVTALSPRPDGSRFLPSKPRLARVAPQRQRRGCFRHACSGGVPPLPFGRGRVRGTRTG